MNEKKSIKDDPNTPKRLCELGVTISMSEGRRIVYCMPEEKLERLIENAEKKQKEKP